MYLFQFKCIQIVSKYIQKLNLTFKATNKDNIIDYTIENLAMLIIKERIIKTTSEKYKIEKTIGNTDKITDSQKMNLQLKNEIF